jgi:hypothetical protein
VRLAGNWVYPFAGEVRLGCEVGDKQLAPAPRHPSSLRDRPLPLRPTLGAGIDAKGHDQVEPVRGKAGEIVHAAQAHSPPLNSFPLKGFFFASALEAEGIEIHTGVRVTEVARDDGGYTVRVENGSLSGEICAAQLLVAAGRKPNTEGLGLEEAGVGTDRKGFIPVDEFMRTSKPDIFAAGDVTGGPGFVYVAAYGGGLAAQAALAEVSGEEAIPADFSTTPRVTFTDPQVAAVGMTEEEARSAGINPKVTSMPVEYLPRRGFIPAAGRDRARRRLRERPSARGAHRRPERRGHHRGGSTCGEIWPAGSGGRLYDTPVPDVG